MNHFYNSYFPNHNRAFHINNLQKGVEKNLPGVEGVDFAERGRSTPKGVGVGRSDIAHTARLKLALGRVFNSGCNTIGPTPHQDVSGK